ncbi:protein of unknown function [Hyphomicrobium sp. 1Nfss2.1]
MIVCTRSLYVLKLGQNLRLCKGQETTKADACKRA